jgi:hypothetical protein
MNKKKLATRSLRQGMRESLKHFQKANEVIAIARLRLEAAEKSGRMTPFEIACCRYILARCTAQSVELRAETLKRLDASPGVGRTD